MIALKDIQQASQQVTPHVHRTPCAPSETLSELLGCQVFLKMENLQITGAFKERGALNKLAALSDEQKEKGVITASAGNHAQGLAFHARRLGIGATIVMPESTPLNKVTSVRRYGPEVVLHGSNYDDSFEEAAALQQRHGYTFVHPFDDPDVIAGQGTIALEMLEEVPELDVILVPVGGGGLISGIAVAAKALKPEIRVVGVQAKQAPAIHNAFSSGSIMPVRPGPTIADGIAVKSPGHLTISVIRQFVDQMVLVSDEEIASAILILLEREKTVVEGAGACPVAAMMYHREALELSDKKVGLVVSGGNIDMNLLSRIIERGMVKDGRMVRLRIELVDVPGQLAKTSRILAEQNANVLEVYHNRSFLHASFGETFLDITLETRGNEHIETIIAALAKEGYRSHNLSQAAAPVNP